MSSIDLIPGDFRRAEALRQRIRRFIAACVLVLVGMAATRMLLGYLTWRERAVVVRIEQQQQLLAHSQAKTEELRQQQRVTEQQLAALDQLRGRDRVALFLSAIDQAYDARIWLDSVHFLRRGGVGMPANAPAATSAGILVVPQAAGAEPQLDVSQGADLYGHAINHSVLAEFMQRLGAQPAVADLRLINTATRSYVDTQVIDFNLSLQVNEKSGAQP
jgi:cell division protein FtsB